MKNLLTLLIIGALIALGGVYLELWKIPQLENFPTINRNSSKSPPSLEESARQRMNQEPDQAPPGGPFAPKHSESARSKQLQESRDQLKH